MRLRCTQRGFVFMRLPSWVMALANSCAVGGRLRCGATDDRIRLRSTAALSRTRSSRDTGRIAHRAPDGLGNMSGSSTLKPLQESQALRSSALYPEGVKSPLPPGTGLGESEGSRRQCVCTRRSLYGVPGFLCFAPSGPRPLRNDRFGNAPMSGARSRLSRFAAFTLPQFRLLLNQPVMPYVRDQACGGMRCFLNGDLSSLVPMVVDGLLVESAQLRVVGDG